MIVPFGGGAEAAATLARALAGLELGPADELIVVDNSSRGEPALAAVPGRVVRAAAARSSYYARNAGAAAASAGWLLFVDADCDPSPALIDAFFAVEPPDRCGAVAGAVLPPRDEGGLLTRYACARGYLDQRAFAGGQGPPYAATANLLVRRRALRSVDGFCEVRSGGDVDFCWRIQEAGWTLELRESAAVRHRHRERLSGLLRQRARYAAGHRWLERRHPTLRPRARVGRLVARAAYELLRAAPRRAPEELRFRLLDLVTALAYAAGRRRSNEPPRRRV